MEVSMKFPSSYNHRLVFQYFPFLQSTQMGSQNLFMNKSVSTLVPFSLVAFLKNRWLGSETPVPNGHACIPQIIEKGHISLDFTLFILGKGKLFT